MAENKSSVTRRGFLAGCGAAAAGVAVTGAAPAGQAAMNWPETLRAWPSAFNELAERFRPLYMAEVARLADTLRPRFESGELRGFTDEDLEDGASGRDSPLWKIEAAAGEHFRLVRRGEDPEPYDGAELVAGVILGVSPSAPFTGDGWEHVAYQANEAATWDVLLHARGQGWYTPGSTEQLGRNREECEAIEAARAAGVQS
jgi:hypothetical protein